MNEPKDLDARLRASHRRVQSLVVELDSAKADLLDAILEAVAAGRSLQGIADVLGLSKSRAQQLVRQADGRGRTRR